MNANTITPGSPTELYRQRRAAGQDHTEAVVEAAHSYGRTVKEMEPTLARARAQVDHPEPHVVEPDLVAVEPDPLDAVEAEIRTRIEGLQSERATLSLDALSDDRKGQELASVEARLAGAYAELERLDLARSEQVKREQEADQKAEQKIVQAALDRAESLSKDRAKAWATLEKTAAGFASALAAHERICGAECQARTAAGQSDAWRTVQPAPWTIEKLFKNALTAARAPTNWLG